MIRPLIRNEKAIIWLYAYEGSGTPNYNSIPEKESMSIALRLGVVKACCASTSEAREADTRQSYRVGPNSAGRLEQDISARTLRFRLICTVPDVSFPF